MKKIYLLFAVLTIAVTANAFNLHLQRENVIKDINTANADVFGDGSVVVTLDSKEKSVNVTLHGAILINNEEQQSAPFGFSGDSEYKTLNIIVSGYNSIKPLTDQYVTSTVFGLADCEANIYSMRTDTDQLSIMNFEDDVIYLNNATLNIGNREQKPLYVSISAQNNGDAIVGRGSGYKAELNIYSATVSIRALAGKLTKDLTGLNLMYNQKISDPNKNVCPIVEHNFFADGCDDHEKGYHGEIDYCRINIHAPYPIFVGKEAITERNNDFFRPSTLINSSNKDAYISYDPDKKVLTFDTVSLGTNVVIDEDDVKLILHGYNSINNSKLNNGDHLVFYGKNASIAGDPKASLTISGANSTGIVAEENLAISGFSGLDIYNVWQGITGSKSLSITVPTEITTSNSGAVLGFDTLIYHDGMIYNPARKYDCSARRLVELENGMLAYSMNLKYEEYLDFFGSKVTALNMQDIKVPGATGKAEYNPQTKTLTLTNFDASGASSVYNALKIENDITIVLNGNNVLKANSDVIALNGDYDLTIEGPGSLSLTSNGDAGIYIPANRKLTIRKGASIEINGYDYGIHGDATLNCDPMESSELVGTYSTLVIDDASIKVTTASSPEAAIWGFKVELKNAVITNPSEATTAFMCFESTPLAGIVKGYVYVDEVTITRKGASAIENTRSSETDVQKIFRNGQLYILHDGVMYNAQGAKVE